MPIERQVILSPGASLALTCLKAWLRDLDRKYYPPIREVDEMVRAISSTADKLYYAGGEKPRVTEEALEDLIVEAVPWLCWERLGPFEWQGYRLFRRSLEIEALFGAKEGGCSAG